MSEPNPTEGDTLYHRLGGEEPIREWVARFYDQVAADPVLAPLFPDDLRMSREKQFRFFVQFFGGPELYQEKYGPAFMRYQHRHVKIGQPERDAWMADLMAALAEITDDAALVNQVKTHVGAMADRMVNHHPEIQDARYFN